MTIREFINSLEVLAQECGDETEIAIFDSYADSEGWNSTVSDVYSTPFAQHIETNKNDFKDGSSFEGVVIS